MNFGDALSALKGGKRVARNGWNGKGMYLFYVATEHWDLSDLIPAGEHLRDLRFNPWIGMKTADNAVVPWLASQTDLLAEDWEVVA